MGAFWHPFGIPSHTRNTAVLEIQMPHSARAQNLHCTVFTGANWSSQGLACVCLYGSSIFCRCRHARHISTVLMKTEMTPVAQNTVLRPSVSITPAALNNTNAARPIQLDLSHHLLSILWTLYIIYFDAPVPGNNYAGGRNKCTFFV